MTSARRRRTVAISLLAPFSACVLSVAVDWAIGHDPMGDAPESTAAKPARDPRVPEFRAQIQRATKAYNEDRRQLMRLQREISDRASQVRAQRAANAARLAAAQAAAASGDSSASGGGSTYVPPGGSGSTSGSGSSSGSSGSGSSGGSVPAPPPPPPPPPPAPPPTQSTTGASG